MLGGGLVFAQVMTLRILKPSWVSLLATEIRRMDANGVLVFLYHSFVLFHTFAI